jgi:hypothetical protein
MMESVNYNFFVGEHILNAVLYGKNGNGVFSLDGVAYEAVEDPDDGYRSYMDEIKVIAPVEKAFEVPVVVEYINKDDKDELVFRDSRNGKTVLSLGTDCLDEYYPLYFFDYTPQNIYENGGAST